MLDLSLVGEHHHNYRGWWEYYLGTWSVFRHCWSNSGKAEARSAAFSPSLQDQAWPYRASKLPPSNLFLWAFPLFGLVRLTLFRLQLRWVHGKAREIITIYGSVTDLLSVIWSVVVATNEKPALLAAPLLCGANSHWTGPPGSWNARYLVQVGSQALWGLFTAVSASNLKWSYFSFTSRKPKAGASLDNTRHLFEQGFYIYM